MLLATAPDLENITKLICQYLYGTAVMVEMDGKEGKVIRLSDNKHLSDMIVKIKKGRYRLEMLT